MGACYELLLYVLGVKTILMVTIQINRVHLLKFEHFTINLLYEKKEDIYVFFWKKHDIINKALTKNAPIYVHYQLVISRSVSFVLAFYIKKYKWRYLDAFDFVSKHRYIINPNRTFEKLIIEYFLWSKTNIFNFRLPKFNYKCHINNWYWLIR